MTLSSSEAAREARLRRRAKRHGYALQRSRWRSGSLDNFGEFRVIDPAYNVVVAGERFDMDLDEAEAWLAG